MTPDLVTFLLLAHYHEQGNAYKKAFIWLTEGRVHDDEAKEQLKAHILIHKQGAERQSTKSDRSHLKLQNTLLVTNLLQQSCTPNPYQTIPPHQLGNKCLNIGAKGAILIQSTRFWLCHSLVYT